MVSVIKKNSNTIMSSIFGDSNYLTMACRMTFENATSPYTSSSSFSSPANVEISIFINNINSVTAKEHGSFSLPMRLIKYVIHVAKVNVNDILNEMFACILCKYSEYRIHVFSNNNIHKIHNIGNHQLTITIARVYLSV